MTPDGLRCDDCGRVHQEWEKVGESSFANGMYAGIRERFKCQHCGEIASQVRA